jgi:hypothetical protein
MTKGLTCNNESKEREREILKKRGDLNRVIERKREIRDSEISTILTDKISRKIYIRQK